MVTSVKSGDITVSTPTCPLHGAWNTGTPQSQHISKSRWKQDTSSRWLKMSMFPQQEHDKDDHMFWEHHNVLRRRLLNGSLLRSTYHKESGALVVLCLCFYPLVADLFSTLGVQRLERQLPPARREHRAHQPCWVTSALPRYRCATDWFLHPSRAGQILKPDGLDALFRRQSSKSILHPLHFQEVIFALLFTTLTQCFSSPTELKNPVI